MSQKKWNLEWNWDKNKELLVIHVFPHRTILIRSDRVEESIIPYLAGLSCFNVILGQNYEMKVRVDSKKPLPEELNHLSTHLKEISRNKFILEFNDLEPNDQLKKFTNKALLFSGGKDSIWQLNYLTKNYDTSDLFLLYVSGATIAGEYIQELATVKKFTKGMNFHVVSIESFDYTSIGLNFCYRPRWRSIMLIGIARMFSDEIWTGISEDRRYITGKDLADIDRLNFFSETPQTLQILATMLNCNIWLSPPESYCFFKIESQKHPYRSCFSSDILCSPETDFENSCWKCRTLHIYRKVGRGEKLTEEEDAFYDSDDWLGDDDETIRNAMKSEIGKPVRINGKH